MSDYPGDKPKFKKFSKVYPQMCNLIESDIRLIAVNRISTVKFKGTIFRIRENAVLKSETRTSVSFKL